MLNFFREIYRIKELRHKVFFILIILIIFRILAAIPVPGIDIARLKSLMQNNQLIGLLNIFTGGSLDNFSLVMLGLGPYITATIILQLFTILSPRIKEMYYEEGEVGRQKFYYYAKIATIPLSILQAYGFIFFLQNQGQGIITNLTTYTLIQFIIAATTGTMILVWLSELITEKGLGNGASILIFAGIVAGLPSSIGQALSTYTPEQLPSYILFIIIGLIVIAGVIFINDAQRLIPVTYARNVRGRSLGGGVSTFIPLKINMAGVIPIIFALSLILFPAMIGGILAQSSNEIIKGIGFFLRDFQNRNFIYAVFYFALVFFFTFFYTAITFEPKEVANNLQKVGGFIPGVRPGEETAKTLSDITTKITFPGAIALGLIAILPIVVQNFTGIRTLSIGGTAILIVVSVVLETYKQIKAQITMREYERL